MATKEPLKPLSKDELTKLATLGIEAKESAHCVYSNFRVGASVLLADGTYHAGANVEVASSPCGTCAERVCIGTVVASMKRPNMPVLRALVVSSDIYPPASPCGMCRQFINEFATKDMPVYMYGTDGLNAEPIVMTMGQLLPMSFGRKDIDENK